MNPTNNRGPKVRVKEMAKILSNTGKGYLVIECEFFKTMNLFDLDRSWLDVRNGKINSQDLAEGASALIDVISHFARQDASRFRKGIGFLNAKYPHAVFFFHDYVLGVANLAPEEIKDCLDQVGIGFGYVQEKKKSFEGA